MFRRNVSCSLVTENVCQVLRFVIGDIVRRVSPDLNYLLTIQRIVKGRKVESWLVSFDLDIGIG